MRVVDLGNGASCERATKLTPERHPACFAARARIDWLAGQLAR